MIHLKELKDRYTPEMATVLLVCRVYFDQATFDDLKAFIESNKIDWKLFEQIIEAHQLRPIVFKVLSKKREIVPDEIFINLRNNCFGIATANLKHVEELIRLYILFTANRIPNVTYKGVTLSQFLFNDYISRETSDIDFLIEPQYFTEVHNLLLVDGYKPRFYNADFEKQILRSSHELLYRKVINNQPVKIEIHWAATSPMMDIPLKNEILFAQTETIKLLNQEVTIFSPENHLLLLLVHHGVNDVWRSLKHTIDIAAFIHKYRNAIDWQHFHNQTKKFKIEHTGIIGFQLVTDLYGIPSPLAIERTDSTPDRILDNLLRYPALRKLKLNAENLSQQVFLRDSLRDKLSLVFNYIRAGIQPNIRDMEAIRLSRNLYPLYYLFKPMRIFFKKK